MEHVIVKYHNDINKLVFNGFSAADFNIFMAICSQVKDHGEQEITLSYDTLKELAGVEKNYTLDEFHARLQVMNKKLMRMDYTIIESPGEETDFVFFPTFHRSKVNQELTVQINKNGAYLLNALAKTFTAFELQEYVTLRSKYAKTLYRLLKQYKSTGEFHVNIDAFKEVMDVSPNYESKTITRRVIKPAVDELKPYFLDLEYEVIRSKRAGRPVLGYCFTFTPEGLTKRQQDTKSDQAPKSSGKTSGRYSRFNDFEQQDYDFDELERRALES